MGSMITNGVWAGLIAGVPFGLAMQLMSAPTPDGGIMPMMGMVAMVERSPSLLVGWLYHLFNSAVIGAFFGGLLGGKVGTIAQSLLWGGVYGLAWWILGGLVLMPVLLGMSAFAPLAGAMLPVALGSLVGHIMYGLVLGLAFVWLGARRPSAARAA